MQEVLSVVSSWTWWGAETREAANHTPSFPSSTMTVCQTKMCDRPVCPWCTPRETPHIVPHPIQKRKGKKRNSVRKQRNWETMTGTPVLQLATHFSCIFYSKKPPDEPDISRDHRLCRNTASSARSCRRCCCRSRCSSNGDNWNNSEAADV